MMWGYKLDEWNTIFSGLNTGVVLIGVPIAIFSLRSMLQQQYIATISKFHEELAATEEQRKFLFQEFERQENYETIDPSTEKKVRDVVNLLNRIALLIDQGMMPSRIVLSLTHTMIIRCWYMLEPYARYQEEILGGRYARRVKKLDARAKRFHDARPHQRIHKVMLVRKGKASSILIYQTTFAKGWRAFPQYVVWTARYLSGRY